eukprot:8974736-Alexandrium_andersonii.AAC.1
MFHVDVAGDAPPDDEMEVGGASPEGEVACAIEDDGDDVVELDDENEEEEEESEYGGGAEHTSSAESGDLAQFPSPRAELGPCPSAIVTRALTHSGWPRGISALLAAHEIMAWVGGAA